MTKWPNVERIVIDALKNYTSRPVFTVTPSDLSKHLPAYQITRVGGADAPDRIGITKRAAVEIDSIAPTRGAAWDAAAAVQSAIYALARSSAGGAYVDETAETFAPAVEQDANANIVRITATYTIVVRPIP